MVKGEESVHVRIEQPVELRKEILNAAIEATTILRFYEHYKLIREQKDKKIQKLEKLLHSLKSDLRKLNRELPKIKEPKKKKAKITETEKIIEKVAAKIRKRPKTLSLITPRALPTKRRRHRLSSGSGPKYSQMSKRGRG